MIYEVIEELSSSHTINALCKVLGVSRSAYYAYTSGQSFSHSAKQVELAQQLQEIFDHHRGRYGSRRLMHELRAMGYAVGRHQIRTLMKLLSIKAIQPRSFVPRTTQADPSKVRSPNLLLDVEWPLEGPNRVIVGDITYLPSAQQGWFYLAVWMDLYSRLIAGWHLGDNMEAELVIQPLRRLIRQRKPPPGLIVHSDGGGQYKATAFRTLLCRNGFRQSMTRKDNHYDNAFCESLFSRIKAELLNDYPYFENLEQARSRVFEYIEGYYNLQRRHSALGYLSPMQFEQRQR